MAIIGKESFVHKVLTNLSSVQLASLASKIDNPGTIETFHLKLSTFSNGIKYVNFYPDEISGIGYKGFLCKTNDYCAVFAFYDCAESMTAFEIDVTNRTAKIRYQNLTAEELRREIDDCEEAAPGGKDAWVEMMKPTMEVNDDDKVEIFDPVVLDENTTIEGNLYVTSGGFAQTNELKVNEIHCFDRGGQVPTVLFKSCDVEIEGNHTFKIGDTTLTEAQLQALLALIN